MRGDLRQGFKHEQAFARSGMWDAEAPLFDELIAIKNQIDVERPRRARVGTGTTEMLFDLEELGEKGARGQHRAACRRGVQEAGLVTHPHRIGVVEPRDTQIVD